MCGRMCVSMCARIFTHLGVTGSGSHGKARWITLEINTAQLLGQPPFTLTKSLHGTYLYLHPISLLLAKVAQFFHTEAKLYIKAQCYHLWLWPGSHSNQSQLFWQCITWFRGSVTESSLYTCVSGFGCWTCFARNKGRKMWKGGGKRKRRPWVTKRKIRCWLCLSRQVWTYCRNLNKGVTYSNSNEEHCHEDMQHVRGVRPVYMTC